MKGGRLGDRRKRQGRGRTSKEYPIKEAREEGVKGRLRNSMKCRQEAKKGNNCTKAGFDKVKVTKNNTEEGFEISQLRKTSCKRLIFNSALTNVKNMD